MKDVQDDSGGLSGSGSAQCGAAAGAWRLANEQSPYLLQHAGNPVEWFPWGQEAFDKAVAENKPVFLSIGYSSCHWCHVMARESFEDADTAAILNRYFVAVKVDREERPDIDRVYMAFVQATTGSGGWPLSVWLTPGLKPFFGGTYFPPDERWSMPWFKSVLTRISGLWRDQHDTITSSADELSARFAEVRQPSSGGGKGGGENFSDDAIRRGFGHFRDSFDRVNGGFGQAPKFPTPPVLDFLLRYHHATGDRQAMDMAETTLRKMAEGGIHDHIGGGFHRYSTDAGWVLPHFEKMLYDQAQLATVYLDAFLVTGDDFFAEVANDTLDYMLSGLAGPEGEFYSAEDADSPVPGNPDVHSEGAFYLWSHDEIFETLGAERAEVFCEHHGIFPQGNIASDPHGEFKNLNIIRVVRTVEETAKTTGIGTEAIRRILDESKEILFARRTLRPRPFKDDKAVLAWNALALSAFARAATVLDSPKYLDAALNNAEFISKNLICANGTKLFRRYRKGNAAIHAFLDDHAFLVQAMLDLHNATLDERYLDRAIEVQKLQDAAFLDPAAPEYFSSPSGDNTLIYRPREDFEGPEPAGNSITAINLLRISQIIEDKDMENRAKSLIANFAEKIHRAPHAMPTMLSAMACSLTPPPLLLVADDSTPEKACEPLKKLRQIYIPNMSIALVSSKSRTIMNNPAATHAAKTNIKPTFLLCSRGTCSPPSISIDVIIQEISLKGGVIR